MESLRTSNQQDSVGKNVMLWLGKQTSRSWRGDLIDLRIANNTSLQSLILKIKIRLLREIKK